MTWSRAEISHLHELARLEAQLDALEQDISHARATSRLATAGRLDLHGHPERSRPRPGGERVRLTDGAEIVIRPIEPEDAAQLRFEFEHLGALSRYRRFLGPVDHLTEEQLRRLTHVDHVTHEALVAEDAREGEGVGTARYVRDPGDARQASVTIVVADAWQGRGAGTALLQRLAARARAAGVERLTGRMVVGDAPARRLADRVGTVVTERCEDGITEVTVALSTEPDP